MHISLIIPLSSEIEEDLSFLRGSFTGEKIHNASLHWRSKYRHFISLHLICPPARHGTCQGQKPSRTILAELDLVLSQMRWSSFPLTLQNVFATPPSSRFPFTELFAGVKKNDQLSQLHQRLANNLRKVGLTPSTRRYRPDLPLAKTAFLPEEQARQWVQRHNLFQSREMDVDTFYMVENFGLYEEIPYTILASYTSDQNRKSNDITNHHDYLGADFYDKE